MAKVHVLHGPNLDLLGEREPETYGHQSLDSIDQELVALGRNLGLVVETLQSNHEGQLVDAVHEAARSADALLINAAGYTHTSVAIRDAVAAARARIAVLEVHLSIPEAREVFRQVSLLAGVVDGRIEGLGSLSYGLALRAASELLRARGVLRDQ
ncbi:MAG: type II 3-dehydroquinate dehydratase [Myxococcota bacterium]